MQKKNSKAPVTNDVFQKENKKIQDQFSFVQNQFDSVHRRIDSLGRKTTEAIDSLEKKLNQKIEKATESLDVKIQNLAFLLLESKKDVSDMKETIKNDLSTKADIHLIINQIDHLSKKVDVYSKKLIVHDYRINQLEAKEKINDKRMTVLEQ